MSRFKSKVDWWMWPLLALPPIGVGSSTVMLLVQGDPGWSTMLPFVLLVVAVYGGLVFPMYYEFQPTFLLVRFGFGRYRVPYEDIIGARPTHNPLSAPALSLDRLLVERRTGSNVLISPVDRARFLEELAARVPGVKVDGKRLVPA